MGSCLTKDSTPANMTVEMFEKEKETQKMLERDLNRMKEKEDIVIKLLLLGAGESGKSTLFKQMINIYGTGFSEEERAVYTPFIHFNALGGMQTLCIESEHFGAVASPLTEIKQQILELKERTPITPDIAEKLAILWKDDGIKATYKKRANFQLSDAVSYFLDKVIEIGKEDYLPSSQDLLHTRVQTKSVIENTFIIGGKPFKMFDVGGQRGLRKKWMPLFDNVTAVIFVAAISEYDQVLIEDAKTNRVTEALVLFDEICNSIHFINTSMILFLNKRDLFQQKVEQVPIKDFFPSYTQPTFLGDNSYDDGCTFFRHAFESKNKSRSKIIYTHITCATDTNNVQHTFTACKDIILRQTLADSGFGTVD